MALSQPENEQSVVLYLLRAASTSIAVVEIPSLCPSRRDDYAVFQPLCASCRCAEPGEAG